MWERPGTPARTTAVRNSSSAESAAPCRSGDSARRRISGSTEPCRGGTAVGWEADMLVSRARVSWAMWRSVSEMRGGNSASTGPRVTRLTAPLYKYKIVHYTTLLAVRLPVVLDQGIEQAECGKLEGALILPEEGGQDREGVCEDAAEIDPQRGGGDGSERLHRGQPSYFILQSVQEYWETARQVLCRYQLQNS